MMPNRFTPGQNSTLRKSRLEGKPSLLPKPRRPGSTDRLSTEARRPSTAGYRSSSAEPARGTFGAHLNREASSMKLSINRRSRSQTSFSQTATTPLATSRYSKPATTPTTPSEERSNRTWQTSLERALAFVTIKDQRPISNAAWQRSENARVAEILAARGEIGGLMRPLTIARFVEIVGALLAALSIDTKLTTDNYITKLPHLSKRVLYPGAVSKSWLRTVNTLHAFPHALALIGYLMDLVSYFEMPILDEWLYECKDKVACLRRDYQYKCWLRFMDDDSQFEDLNEDYLKNLTLLLEIDEKKITELQQVIKNYEICLEDEEERAARADEERRVARRDALVAALRSARAARAEARAGRDQLTVKCRDTADAARALDADVEKASVELERECTELEKQTMSVAERARLLDEVDYVTRVHESKRALAEKLAKTVLSKETELHFWQKKTLDSCMEYNELLIHLTANMPELTNLAVDQNSLMSAECGARVSCALEALRERCGALGAERAATQRQRSARGRRTAAALEETRAKITEVKSSTQREQQSLDSELAKEASEAATWAAEELEVAERLERLKTNCGEYVRVDRELTFWEEQDIAWRTKLSALKQYVASQEVESKRRLEEARDKRLRLLRENIALWNEKISR